MGPVVRHAFPSYRVFIFGLEVTADVVSCTTQSHDGRAPNTCQIQLTSPLSRYVITNDDVRAISQQLLKSYTSDIGADGESVITYKDNNVKMDVSFIADKQKLKVVQEKIKVQLTQIPTTSPVVSEIDGQAFIAERYPFQSGKAIFHPMDPIRVYFRDPFNPSNWYHEFTGVVSDISERLDKNNEQFVTLTCEDPSKLLRYARYTTNPGIVDINDTAVREAIVNDFIQRVPFASIFTECTLQEIMFILLFGLRAFAKASSGKELPTGLKIALTDAVTAATQKSYTASTTKVTPNASTVGTSVEVGSVRFADLTGSTHPSNYRATNSSRQINQIVIHYTEGEYRGAVNWFAQDHRNNPDPKKQAPSSAHYIIARDGRAVRMVADNNIAYHAGVVGATTNMNDHSIGIELEVVGTTTPLASAFTQPMMDELAVICRNLISAYHIPADRAHIIGHNEVPGANHTDPGPNFPWQAFMASLQANAPVNTTPINAAAAAKSTTLQAAQTSTYQLPGSDVEMKEFVNEFLYSASGRSPVPVPKRIHGVGHANLGQSTVWFYGNPKPSEQGTPSPAMKVKGLGQSDLEEYEFRVDCLVSVTDPALMRAEGLTDTDYKYNVDNPTIDQVITEIGEHPEIYPVDGGSLQMLLPDSFGPENRNIVLKDLLGNFNMNTEWSSRAQTIYDIIDRIDFVFYVTGRGDYIVEFPMYDFEPKDFGTMFRESRIISTDDTVGVDSTLTDAQIVTQLAVPKALVPNYSFQDQLANIISLKWVTLWHMIPLYGVRTMPSVSKNYIQTDEGARMYAHICLNRTNANAFTQTVRHVPRVQARLNRPYYIEVREHIGTTKSVNHNITWGQQGTASTELGLYGMRGWSGAEVDGNKVYTSIAGPGSNPLNYKTLFDPPKPTVAPSNAKRVTNPDATQATPVPAQTGVPYANPPVSQEPTGVPYKLPEQVSPATGLPFQIDFTKARQ